VPFTYGLSNPSQLQRRNPHHGWVGQSGPLADIARSTRPRV